MVGIFEGYEGARRNRDPFAFHQRQIFCMERGRLESSEPFVFVDGANIPFANHGLVCSSQDHAQNLMNEAPKQIAFLAGRFSRGDLPENANIYEYLLSLPSVNKRRNPYIFVSDDSPLKVVDLVQGQARPLVDSLSYISNGQHKYHCKLLLEVLLPFCQLLISQSVPLLNF